MILLNFEGKKEIWFAGSSMEPGQLEDEKVFRKMRLQEIFGSIDSSAAEYDVASVGCCWETKFVVLSSKDETKDDRLVSWGGENAFGELGRKATEPQLCGEVDFSHIEQDTYPRKIERLSCGVRHSLCLLSLGGSQVLVGWGASRHGQLGSKESVIPLPRTIDLGASSAVLDLAVGKDHSAILLYWEQEMSVLSLGSGRRNQLGHKEDGFEQKPGEQSVLKIPSSTYRLFCTWNGTYLHDKNNTQIFGWGIDTHGQLPRSHPSSTVIPSSISRAMDPIRINISSFVADFNAGSEHLLVSSTDGQVWGWGWNEHGNLGVEGLESIREPRRLKIDEERAHIERVFGGNGTSFIFCKVLDDDASL
ncbi:RCC1/BLIP-II [Atractiella rhizophila]|nr:RCC1/BLIP-II [Atractiella rhizophila]